MSLEFLAAVAAGLLPATLFLIVLVLIDSYKLVSLRQVLVLITLGGAAALISYAGNAAILALTELSFKSMSRYVAPAIEESVKALVVIYLLRSNRVGFLVDAAICGFAVGTGFAIVENLYYLQSAAVLSVDQWLVRGFGTAIMHGGVAAIFAVVAQALSEGREKVSYFDILPGLLLAMLTHSLYNHFVLSPWLSTMLMVVLMPLLALYTFQLSEQALENWLNTGFDADTELLEIINSGEFSESHVGQYLERIKHRFAPAIVFDLVCYLRLHVELALRAKGVLMARDSGFEIETGEDVKANLDELAALQDRVGRTGLIALKPFLHFSRKDLWQIYMLGK